MRSKKEEMVIPEGQISIDEYVLTEFGAERIKEADEPSDEPDYEIELKM